MNPELLLFHERVVKCKRPEDLFGPLSGNLDAQLKTLRTLFRKFAAISHVDKYLRLDEQRIAHIAFSCLNALHREAEALLNEGKYGTGARAAKKNLTPASMRSSKGLYVVSSGLAGGDLSTIYLGEFEGKTSVVLKITSHPSLNNLLDIESKVLERLNEVAKDTAAYKQFVPTILDHFAIRVPDGSTRRVNVFSRVEGLHPLTDVVSQFPDGLDGRHFVWIFTRLLSTLSFVHDQGIIHGAILPTHALINPTTHGIHLVDWCFTVPIGSKLIAMSKGYASYYPPEIVERRPVTSTSDIYMAAMSMSYILGADYGLNFKPSLHPKFKRLLETCLFKNPARRPTSAWELLEEVQAIAKEAYGPKKFVKLEMV